RGERLRHVIVRAAFQSPNLLLLLADRREHQDRHLAPLPESAADLDTVSVRKHEVDDGGVGWAHGGLVEGFPGAHRRYHLKSGVSKHDLQRPEYLRLVVADKDAPCVIHRATLSAKGRTRHLARSPSTDPHLLIPIYRSPRLL